MSTSGGSEDAFHLTNGSLNFQGQSDVSGGEERRRCPPVAGLLMLLLTDMFALASHLIQTICCGSLHLCRIATTLMSYICCTLYCLAGSCSSL